MSKEKPVCITCLLSVCVVIIRYRAPQGWIGYFAFFITAPAIRQVPSTKALTIQGGEVKQTSEYAAYG